MLTCPVKKTCTLSHWYTIRRDFSNENVKKFQTCLQSLTFYDVFSSNDPEYAFDSFFEDFKLFYDLCFPKIKIRNTCVKKTRWLSKGIGKCCKQKRKLLWNYRTNPSESQKQILKNYSARLKRIIKLTQKCQNNYYISNADNKSKATWRIINSKYRGGCGCTARLPTDNRPELARVAAAEALGAALLVLLSCFPSCLPTPLSSTHTALASGCVVAMLVQGLDHISGAMMNPTVTLAAVVWGRVSAVRAIVMFAAQLAGGAAGAAALAALVPAGGSLAGCLTVPAPGVSTARAVAVEAVLGACLALVNCAAWDPRNQHLRDSWPLRIGTSVAAMSLVAGTLTGASMNPARSLAPAVLLGQFHHHWVYWVGPLSGGAGAAALYCALWRPPPPRAAPAPALPRPLSKHCTAACCSREDWRAPGGGG